MDTFIGLLYGLSLDTSPGIPLSRLGRYILLWVVKGRVTNHSSLLGSVLVSALKIPCPGKPISSGKNKDDGSP